MKKSFERSLLLAGVLFLIRPMDGPAQDYFRDFGTSRSSGGLGPIVPTDYTYQDGSPSGLQPLRPGEDLSTAELTEENDKYNFALGPLRFAVAAGLGLEWNDNIYLSDEDRESDFAIRPSLNLDASWRITDLNTLRLNVGASYAKYLDHSDLDTDGILITPNSELALTFYLGTVKFTIRDRFSYQEDTYDVPTLSSRARYGRYENQAGIQAEWQINQQLDLTTGYDHYNLWAKDEQFTREDRAIDTVFLRPGVQVTPALKLGVNAAYSYINFESDARADGDNIMVGPYAEYQVSDNTNLYLEVGYQNLSYDGETDFSDSVLDEFDLSDEDRNAVRGLLEENEDASSYYVKLEIQNKPTEFFRHRLSGSKTAEIGVASDYYDLYHVEYDAEWQINPKWDMGPSVFYEYYETSGRDGEEAHRYGATFGIRTHLTDSITLGLDYRFLLKDSNIEGFDYYQNLALLSIYYKF